MDVYSADAVALGPTSLGLLSAIDHVGATASVNVDSPLQAVEWLLL